MPQKDLPALTGLQLIALLQRDGWELRGSTRHGALLITFDAETQRWRRVTIPKRSGSLPKRLLHRILSVKQSGIGRKGLQSIIEKYGLP